MTEIPNRPDCPCHGEPMPSLGAEKGFICAHKSRARRRIYRENNLEKDKAAQREYQFRRRERLRTEGRCPQCRQILEVSG